MPRTSPAGPTRRARAIVVSPQPQPTSITRSPGAMLARSIVRSPSGAICASMTFWKDTHFGPAASFQ